MSCPLAWRSRPDEALIPSTGTIADLVHRSTSVAPFADFEMSGRAMSTGTANGTHPKQMEIE
ncbi:hypothetical protein ACNI3Q_00125 [Sphingomonas sp. FW199]|uniref:hypothetical protein n=1 Tax=Sphingomonas sp. FW199 TaxID=3400217 RepID=UPI003CEAADE8